MSNLLETLAALPPHASVPLALFCGLLLGMAFDWVLDKPKGSQ